MAKIQSNLKVISNVFKNTVKLGLWRAALRKIYSQSTQDILSEDARVYYQQSKLPMKQVMRVLGFETQDFRWAPDAEYYLSAREQEGIKVDATEATTQSKRQRMGGIASVEFLYSLVKAKSKKNCLECGVSMGGSSLSILKALQSNQEGVLYSNDLPYLWMDEPLKDLGVLVSDDLRDRWELSLGDDRDNLPSMLKAMGIVDMAHYDSNKAYSARDNFWRSLIPFMSEQCTIVFDDIVDNDHFFDLATSLSKDVWKVFVVEDEGKLFGLLQKL
jgi:predicted O-methyltransferase YrrM